MTKEVDEINPPMEVLIPGYSRKKVFKRWSDVKNFFDEEFSAWEWLQGFNERPPLKQAAQHFIDIIERARQAAQVLSRDPRNDDQKFITQITNAFSLYESNELIYSKSEDGRFILELASRNQDSAVGVLAGLSSENWQIQHSAWRPLIWGMAEYLINKQVDPKRIDYVNESLESLREEWSSRLGEQEDEFQNLNDRLRHKEDEIYDKQNRLSKYWKEQVRNKIKFFNDATEQRIALQTAFREHMRLKAPVDYWNSKTKYHARTAAMSFIIFLILSVTAIILFFDNSKSLMNLLASGNSSGWPLGNLVVVTIPALLFFWILRFIARVFVTNIQRQQDAHERATMAQTYLSLIAEGDKAATDQERVLVLNALFRPGPGDSPDEAPSADLVEIMRQMRR